MGDKVYKLLYAIFNLTCSLIALLLMIVAAFDASKGDYDRATYLAVIGSFLALSQQVKR